MDIANQPKAAWWWARATFPSCALGWATYNGDHMSMYGVNCSIPKTLIRHLVRLRGLDTPARPRCERRCCDVLDTPVSPELLPPKDGEIAQKTEDLVGPYRAARFLPLPHACAAARRAGKVLRLAKIAFAGRVRRGDHPQVAEDVHCGASSSSSSSAPACPTGPRWARVSLSPRGDWRMPSDAFSALWDADLENCPQ